MASLALAGCATPHATGTCDRAGYWVGADEFEADAVRPEYLADLEDTFQLDLLTGEPTRGLIVWERLDDLERHCWATRAR